MSSTSGAYCKAVMHCYQYPTQPVMGFLIARTNDPSLAVCDAIPVMHSAAASAPHPVVEVAAIQIDAVCRSRGRCIVGVYVASERLDDTAVSLHTTRLLAHLLKQADDDAQSGQRAAGAPELLLWQMTNSAVNPQTGKVAVTCYAVTGGLRGHASVTTRDMAGAAAEQALQFVRWNPDSLAANAVPHGDVFARLADAVERRHFVQLVDFEQHLHDCTKDYNNTWFDE
jgi:hypothetical protein